MTTPRGSSTRATRASTGDSRRPRSGPHDAGDLDAAVEACRETGVPADDARRRHEPRGPGDRARAGGRLLGPREIAIDPDARVARVGPGRGARRPEPRRGRSRARLRPRRRHREPGHARGHDRQQLGRRPVGGARADGRPRPRPGGDARRRDARRRCGAVRPRPPALEGARRLAAAARPPDLVRRVSGYALEALGGDAPDWPRLLCGSEGTLAVTRRAELRLVERPAARGSRS